MENRKVKQVLSGHWYQWKEGGYKERVWEGDYGGNKSGTMRIVETILRMEEGEIKENNEGDELNYDIL
jgi:hypothetical protein